MCREGPRERRWMRKKRVLWIMESEAEPTEGRERGVRGQFPLLLRLLVRLVPLIVVGITLQ
jgi:hypothetical protein